MADPKINIRIATTADTKAVEKTTDALEDLNQAQEQVAESSVNPMSDGSQAEALNEAAQATEAVTEALADQTTEADKAAKAAEDLAAAQSKQDVATIKANRSAADQAKQLREVQIAAKGLLALQLTEKLSGALQDLQGFASDRAGDGSKLGATMAKAKPAIDGVASGVKGIGVGLGVAVATANPILGLFAGIASQIKDAGTAAFDLYEQFQLLEQSEKNAVLQANALAEAQKNVGKEVAASNIENIYHLQALAAERLLAAVQAVNIEERARAGAGAAARKFANEEAIRGGADPGLVAANEALAGLNDSKAELARQITEARAGLEALQVEADRTYNIASEARNSGQKSAEEIAAANDAYDRANQALGNAEKQIEALERAGEFAKDALVSQTQSTIGGIVDSVGSQVTAKTNEAIKLIEGIAAENGGKLSGEASRILNNLYEIVRNSIPDEEEAGRLALEISTFRSFAREANAKNVAAFVALQDDFRTLANRYDQLQREQNQIRALLGTTPGNR